jgi:UDP-2,3-diacylglucosamine pyrophosphatase LpxH
VATLVISDLHLGSRLGRDVLRRPEALEALLAALDGVERLVLLGDVVELLEGRQRQALDVAEPVLRALAARLGSAAEVIVVPGNHDAGFVRPWVRARDGALAVETPIPLDATPALARLTSWLEPARVRVSYPGVWLADRVWATHGHYLDRHLLPEAAYGVARGLLGRLPRDGATPADYEGGPSATRVEAMLTRWLPRPLAELMDELAELLRAATMPGSPRRVLGRHLAPFAQRALGAQMRRASIPALARVVHRLGVDADWVVFGHVHRCGPLAGDVLRQWSGPGGVPRIANTGSWVYEPVLLQGVTPPHPYWPGGAIRLAEGGEPEAIGLLDHLGAAALHP